MNPEKQLRHFVDARLAKAMLTPADCLRCKLPMGDEVGEYEQDDQGKPIGRYHTVCPVDTKQTTDEKYNALCQTIDRIMTGNPEIRARGGAISSVAETWRDQEGKSRGVERAVVRFDHDAIKKWARDSWDRTALTLALNVHELGHLWHSPVYGSKDNHTTDDRFFMNVLDDQRQEMLSTILYPKALDYLRFLNSRGLKKVIEECRDDDNVVGRQYMLHYGRRHLYPPSINARLEAAAITKYGPDIARRIRGIIGEFMALDLETYMAHHTAWDLARELSLIDQQFDPDTRGGITSTLVIGDPRHDCLPMDGTPILDKKTREQLTKELRELLKSAPQVAEPTKPQKRRAQKPKERGEGSGEKEKADDQKSNGEAGKDTDDSSAEREEGAGDAEQETEAGKSNQASEGLGGGEDDGEDDESDTKTRGGTRAGKNENPSLEEPPEEEKSDDTELTLEVLAEEALDRIEGEIEDRHEALKGSSMRPQMGGKLKGPLASTHVDAARRLGLMFRNINQDLVPQTERAVRKGRIDSRRLPLSVTTSSQRIFKRRIKDLSREAALAVYIMIDVSGSMDHSVNRGGQTRKSVALAAGFTLARAVELAGHIAKVVEFSDFDYVEKNWLDRIYQETSRPGDGGTQPESALRRAMVDFPYIQKETDIHNHVVIILTDGAWSNPETCAATLRALVKTGVFVIEIGIQTNPVPVHGAWKIMKIDDVAELASAMVDPLRKLAIEIAKNVKRRVA